MSREFPHCEVLGIDLAPVPLTEDGHPPNCRFEMDDISRGISHLHGQFDVVFARFIALGLKDFRKSLSDATACLKPGGILIWIDVDLCFYSGWPMVYHPFWSSSNPERSYATRILYGEYSFGIVIDNRF
jgi:Methyltransferase domain